MIYWLIPLLLSFFLPLGAKTCRIEDQCNLSILSPSLAERKSAKMVLENGLEVYLISDPETHESGAALSVNVGSFADPDARPGMAHFVEHMLFMGTEKYPEEEGYHKFLNEHGGKCNAFTADDRTVYGFICHNENYLEGLDRFANFFMAPLFAPSSLKREACAIDQEFCKDLSLEGWRTHHVKKAVANTNHPFHRFCIGNRKTLADVTSEELRSWYESHYSSDKMHLVVYSKLPLEEIENQVMHIFSSIPKRATQESIASTAPLFPEGLQNNLLVVAPIQELMQLEICWELPTEYTKDRESHADELISFVLGHEGENSLYTYLKNQHFIEALSCGKDSLGKDKQLFNITCKLTKKGVENYEKVIQSTLQAVDAYAQHGVPSYIFDELCTMKKLEYAYQSRENLFNKLMEYASTLVVEPLATFPERTLLPSNYAKEPIAAFFKELSPKSCYITLVTDPKLLKIKTDKKEPWMEVEYTLVPLSSEIATLTAASFALPSPNPFIPQLLKVHNQNSKEETILPKVTLGFEDERQRLFYACDEKILIPEISWVIEYRTPQIRSDRSESLVLANLYTYVINKKLNALFYNAKLGGLGCDITTADNGLRLHFHGFSEKAFPFLQAVVEEMLSFIPVEKDFEQAKEFYKVEYDNKLNKTAISQAGDVTHSLLYKDHASWGNKLKALKVITYGEFMEFCDKLFEKGYLETLLYGNLNQAMSSEVSNFFKEKFQGAPYPIEEHYTKKVAVFDKKGPAYFVRKSRHPANVVILYLEAGSFSFEKQAALKVLSKAIEEPFFSELRTKQQTGYVVNNWADEIQKNLFAFFLTQSSSHDTRDLISRFELFFESSLTHLEEFLPKERFESVRSSLILSLQHPPEAMETMGALLHKLAFEYEADFAWRAKEIAALQELTYEQFLPFAKNFLGKENKKRLAVCVEGVIPEREIISYKKEKLAKD